MYTLKFTTAEGAVTETEVVSPEQAEEPFIIETCRSFGYDGAHVYDGPTIIFCDDGYGGDVEANYCGWVDAR